MKQYIRPEYLKKGDTVAVVAMASSLSEKSRQTLYWKEMLESWGLHVKLGKHLYDSAPGENLPVPTKTAQPTSPRCCVILKSRR